MEYVCKKLEIWLELGWLHYRTILGQLVHKFHVNISNCKSSKMNVHLQRVTCKLMTRRRKY